MVDKFFNRYLNLPTPFARKRYSRRDFMKLGLAGFVYFLFSRRVFQDVFKKQNESIGRPKKGIKGRYDLVVAEGPNPYENTIKAIEAMGGMSRFVKKNDVVVVKPNMAFDRTPQQAANTNPQVVSALVELCYLAGAKRVNVFDISANDPKRVYVTSRIKEAAEKKGARVYFAEHWNTVSAKFSYPTPMEGWPIFRDAVECDVFINVPVLKHHSLTRWTLSMKNLMGVCSGQRQLMHLNIGRKLVDLTDYISPELTVVDATRVLIRNGPTGGSLNDVVHMNKVFVSTDPTLADAYACTLVNADPMSVPYIREAANRGFGSSDIKSASIHKVHT